MVLAKGWWAAGICDGVSFLPSLRIVCIYACAYMALDWVSFVYVLPTTSFTLWNPPPACSLALLLLGGLGYAPVLFVVSFVSDGLIAGFPTGIAPTAVADAITAAGYTSVAFTLHRLSHADQWFQSVADVARFLLVVALGVLAIAGLTTAAFVLLHGFPMAQFPPAVIHFWIGDLTGIVGLLPVLMSTHSVCQRWSEQTPLQWSGDISIFTAGLTLALVFVFGIAGYRELHFFYLLLLPVIWVAVRHGFAWSAAAVLATQLGVVSTVVALDYVSSEFLEFQFLLLTIGATGLLVGAVVTERQRAERDLRRRQAELDRMTRLTTAGALGMAVVHQISQPLATIATYLHACRQVLVSGSDARGILAETMTKAEVEVLRAGGIVDRLRDFSSHGSRRLSRVDLGVVARGIVAAVADDAHRHGVDIQLSERSIAPVVVDRVQIEQVLINLIRNAIDAAAGNDAGDKRVRVALRDFGDEVEVIVEDDGPGVAPELALRLFEPFETTKRSGMGLGLWLSRQLVEGHGGRLWWDPDTTAGARFVFRLPRSGETP
jgi:two-component system, LuxR family, sensor kinase FixL